MCRTLMAPRVQSVFEYGGAKSGCLTGRAVFVDYPLPVSSWSEAMGKVELPVVRIQPVDCQLYHSFDIKRLDFIQAFSDLSSLKIKQTCLTGSGLHLWNLTLRCVKIIHIIFFFLQYFV